MEIYKIIENGEVNTKKICTMVDTFIEEGFNYFDTAHGYLGGKCERIYPRHLEIRNLLTDVAAEFL